MHDVNRSGALQALASDDWRWRRELGLLCGVTRGSVGLGRRVVALPPWKRWAVYSGGTLALAVATFGVIRFGLSSRVTLHNEPLSWLDWVYLTGVAFTVIALLVGITQLIRVATASESAREAVD